MVDINKVISDNRPHFFASSEDSRVAMVTDDRDKMTSDLGEVFEYKTAYGAFAKLRECFKRGFVSRYSTDTVGIGHMGR